MSRIIYIDSEAKKLLQNFEGIQKIRLYVSISEF